MIDKLDLTQTDLKNLLLKEVSQRSPSKYLPTTWTYVHRTNDDSRLLELLHQYLPKGDDDVPFPPPDYITLALDMGSLLAYADFDYKFKWSGTMVRKDYVCKSLQKNFINDLLSPKNS